MSSVLILGATSDIARSLAHQFAQKADKIYLGARNADRLQKDVADLQIRYQTKAEALEFDAENYNFHQEFYQRLDPKPDIVCVVFGYLGKQERAEKNWGEAKQILEVNYVGAASILHHVANDMENRGKGTIVGISSVAGERGRASNYLYGSAKAGFTAFLSGLRNRLTKKGVHVVTVKPGFVDTAMTADMDLPGPITATADEVAKAVVKAVDKKKNIIYVKWMWRYIMMIIRNIPESIFKKLSL